MKCVHKKFDEVRRICIPLWNVCKSSQVCSKSTFRTYVDEIFSGFYRKINVSMFDIFTGCKMIFWYFGRKHFYLIFDILDAPKSLVNFQNHLFHPDTYILGPVTSEMQLRSRPSKKTHPTNLEDVRSRVVSRSFSRLCMKTVGSTPRLGSGRGGQCN